MNVGPVQASPAGIERQTPEKKLFLVPPSHSDESKTSTKEVTPQPNENPVPLLIPEHDVTVQWDATENDVMIYKVLDKQSGDLVFQVPSAEVLNGIHQTQELLQRIAARGKHAIPEAPPAQATAKEDAASKEDNGNGNKL